MDSPNQSIMKFVDQGIEFIKDAIKDNKAGEPPKNKVLVHCYAGKSRATTLVLSYMIREKKVNLKDALTRVKEVRPVAAPNPGFMIQLKTIEKATLGRMSECDVMQGHWKEQLEQLQKQKAAMAESGEQVSPLNIPDENKIIKNAETQFGLDTKKCDKDDDNDDEPEEKKQVEVTVE